MMESVAVADVPDTPLSTIGGAGIIPLAEPLAAQFTLTLLLLQYLKRNGGEFRSAGEDAVLIELDFVHVPMIAKNGMEVKRSGRFRDRHMPLSISAIASWYSS